MANETLGVKWALYETPTLKDFFPRKHCQKLHFFGMLFENEN